MAGVVCVAIVVQPHSSHAHTTALIAQSHKRIHTLRNMYAECAVYIDIYFCLFFKFTSFTSIYVCI